jgi:UDP-N-acetylmuramate--alanine ligase
VVLNNLFKGLKVHFIGIGGIGMSGIAEVLVHHGLMVSGSDSNESNTTARLSELGVKIYIGHQAENIGTSSIVVYSSAIQESNPELSEARRLNRPTMRRAEMLAELMKLKHGIAIAGTHGKTTTTSMLATILMESGLDPTYIIGGIVKNLQGHAKVGRGECLVAEADESDGTFLLLNPIMSVITNIDNDHLDFYETAENLRESFIKFANNIPFYGRIALNANDPVVLSIIPEMRKPYLTFGIQNDGIHELDYSAKIIESKSDGAKFDLYLKNEKQETIEIKLPGEHNVLNALGAITIASEMGLSLSQIKSAINKFEGVGRRFQKLFDENNFVLFDDYGHHPTEIAETIKTAKAVKENKKLIVIFEPHRYTRTRDCWNQFMHCFNGADKLYLAPVYPASEREIVGINSQNLSNDINRIHKDLSTDIENLNGIEDVIKQYRNDNAFVLCMGAGSIGKLIREVIGRL